MKSLIESIKLHWADFTGLFTKKPAYYYTLEGNKDPVKVAIDKECCSETHCSCKETSDYTYEEPTADSETTSEPIRTKAQLKALSKLELQVIAQNEGIKLSGKENKQQIINKLAKLAL